MKKRRKKKKDLFSFSFSLITYGRRPVVKQSHYICANQVRLVYSVHISCRIIYTPYFTYIYIYACFAPRGEKVARSRSAYPPRPQCRYIPGPMLHCLHNKLSYAKRAPANVFSRDIVKVPKKLIFLCTNEGKGSDRTVHTPLVHGPKTPKVAFFKKSMRNARANSTLNHF